MGRGIDLNLKAFISDSDVLILRYDPMRLIQTCLKFKISYVYIDIASSYF